MPPQPVDSTMLLVHNTTSGRTWCEHSLYKLATAKPNSTSPPAYILQRKQPPDGAWIHWLARPLVINTPEYTDQPGPWWSTLLNTLTSPTPGDQHTWIHWLARPLVINTPEYTDQPGPWWSTLLNTLTSPAPGDQHAWIHWLARPLVINTPEYTD